ncbi:hypothetical protein WMY93_007158 [Mugilogobius chulae]|uniref:Ig-like domain-containing protein n=1 Tax=Mugilogobius chulae TaxID=88201 RepID=A0AAW0PT50_9GOBI
MKSKCKSSGAAALFTIRSISLSLEPGEDVTRDTNVTVRCSASVSSSGQQPLSREYIIYKEGVTVYAKTTSSSEDLLYVLSHARVSNTGKYKCKITIEGKSMTSEARKLTVTGLAPPVVRVEQNMLTEGEEINATCTAPGETGSIIFYFYEDLKEKQDNGPGHHTIECSYKVLITPDSISSEKSSPAYVSVRGDKLGLSCWVQGIRNYFDSVNLYLSQGTKLLRIGQNEVNYTMTVLDHDSSEFECRLEKDKLTKAVTKAVPVTELFSVPTLTMSPVEVFQREPMKLICKSDHIVPERLSIEDLTYSIIPDQIHLQEKNKGEFSGRALPVEFNYSCIAMAKGVIKYSKTLTVRPKVSVSIPKISVVNRPIIGRPFKIRCQSDNGSLPINYTLLQDYNPVSTVTVRVPSEEALFTVTVHKPKDINKFICEASNSRREGLLSTKLDVTVIEPVSYPVLTVIPSLSEITEGSTLIFICSVSGTPPITFKLYRQDYDQPLLFNTTARNNTSFEIHQVSKITAESTSLRPSTTPTTLCPVRRQHTGHQAVDRTTVSVWTERPPHVSEENSVVSNEPDVEYTEVVHPRSGDPARVPLKKGTDTVYSELQNSPHGEADPLPYGSVEYADLNGEPPDVNNYPLSHYDQELPVPVD